MWGGVTDVINCAKFFENQFKGSGAGRPWKLHPQLKPFVALTTVLRYRAHCDLSLYVLNAAGLSKLHAVEHLAADFNSYDVDIAVITETHFCAKHTDNILSVPGYTLYRRDRSIRNKSGRRMKGGGVAVYIRSTLLSTRECKTGRYFSKPVLRFWRPSKPVLNRFLII